MIHLSLLGDNRKVYYQLVVINNSMYLKDQVFKNRLGKICGRQPLKNFTWSSILCPIWH